MSPLRRGRNPTVVVTGAAGGLGAVLAARLAGNASVSRVIGVDIRRGTARGVVWRRCDVRDPVLDTAFKGADVIVHLATDMAADADDAERRGLNVGGTRQVLASAGSRPVVIVSSALVYAPPAPPAGGHTESAGLRPDTGEAMVSDLLEIEALAAAHPGPVTVLRPSLLVGPMCDTPLLRLFEAPRLLVVRGGQPRWQLCHTDDLVAALELVATAPVDGPVNVSSPGWLEQSEVERISGRRRLELPLAVALGTAERLHRLGVTAAPATEIEYLLDPWIVDTGRLEGLGWQPSYDNAAALRAHLDAGRPRTPMVDRRAAAGATVAVVATAAIVRNARRRRGR